MAPALIYVCEFIRSLDFLYLRVFFENPMVCVQTVRSFIRSTVLFVVIFITVLLFLRGAAQQLHALVAELLREGPAVFFILLPYGL